MVFGQDDCEFPLDWSDTAVRIVASKYFRYGMDDPRRERSLRQVIDRVVDTIRHHGVAGGYFADDEEAETFAQELRHILVTQKAAFNSPVWFNCGVDAATREHDEDRILDVDDPPIERRTSRRSTRPRPASSSRSTTRCPRSSAGSPRSRRSSAAARARASTSRACAATARPLSNGGQASGPVSFMRWADSGAGSIKSGGGTRRAAKMVILDGDHPDILEFVRCKAHEEAKAYALGRDGLRPRPERRRLALDPVPERQQLGAPHGRLLPPRRRRRGLADADGRPGERARRAAGRTSCCAEISEAAWACGDPGVQYEDTIQRWHTSPNAGRISGSNPCSEYMHIDDSACNLASINLMKFLDEDGTFRIDDFRHTVRVVLTAQEIIVTPASYPTKRIGDNARAYRQLGQGYTNLGSLLMCQGAGLRLRRGPRLGRRHHRPAAGRGLRPVGAARRARGRVRRLRGRQGGAGPGGADAPRRGARPAGARRPARTTTPTVRAAASASLDDAVALGQAEGRNGAPGYRNAQVSVIAPTGTISFMMDAQTTGIEPAIGLISYKTLVGGGYMKLVNTDVERALRALGYDAAEQRRDPRPRGRHRLHRGRPGPGRVAPVGVRLRLRRGRRAHDRPGGPRADDGRGAAVRVGRDQQDGQPAQLGDRRGRQRHLPLGWELGLKAIAIYRDGSKRTQPLSTTDGSAGDGRGRRPTARSPPRCAGACRTTAPR